MKITSVPTEDLRALFDVAVNSLNFGSGFLDTDEVNVLRRIAILIGVDPTVATPSNFATQYSHAFQERELKFVDPSLRKMLADQCEHCGRSGDDPLHHAE